jgi:hypothetical protein
LAAIWLAFGRPQINLPASATPCSALGERRPSSRSRYTRTQSLQGELTPAEGPDRPPASRKTCPKESSHPSRIPRNAALAVEGTPKHTSRVCIKLLTQLPEHNTPLSVNPSSDEWNRSTPAVRPKVARHSSRAAFGYRQRRLLTIRNARYSRIMRGRGCCKRQIGWAGRPLGEWTTLITV